MQAISTATELEPDAVELARQQHLEVIGRAIDAAGGAAALARHLGLTTQAVIFWREGKRAVHEKHGAEIERAGGGVVTREAMWPDTWRRTWPELIGRNPAANEPGGHAAG